MAIEHSFRLLRRRLTLLKEAVDELHLNISGDYYPQSRPNHQAGVDEVREQPPFPVEQLDDAVSDLQGAIEEAQHAAATTERALRYPRRLPEIQTALITIQRCMNGVLKTYLEDVYAYESMQRLAVMGSRKGGEWPKWVALVRTVIQACRSPLYETFQALLECWQELAEITAPKAISLQTAMIGQQITKPEHQKHATN